MTSEETRSGMLICRDYPTPQNLYRLSPELAEELLFQCLKASSQVKLPRRFILGKDIILLRNKHGDLNIIVYE